MNTYQVVLGLHRQILCARRLICRTISTIMLMENTGICLHFTQQHNNFWGGGGGMDRYIVLELEINEHRNHRKFQNVKVLSDVRLRSNSWQPWFVLTWVGIIL
jgi:hypothetical protein